MLTYDDKMRIQTEVILGKPAPAYEDTEKAAWRQALTDDIANDREDGFMPDYPDLDWDDPSVLNYD